MCAAPSSIAVSRSKHSQLVPRNADRAGTPACGGPLSYNVYRSFNPVFTPGPANVIAQCLSATSYLDQKGLVGGQTRTPKVIVISYNEIDPAVKLNNEGTVAL